MIKFPCFCQYNFALEDDQAGGEIQCPKCGRLNDIPTLDQLKNIKSDGTIHIDLAPVEPDQGRVGNLLRVYTKGRVDDDGSEIDLRNSPEDIPATGVIASGFALAGDPAAGRPLPPKYDPVTGELIRTIEFSEAKEAAVPVQAIPLARATLTYARGIHQDVQRVRAPFLQLLAPINIVVMFFIFIAHVIFTATAAPIVDGIPVTLIVTVVVGIALIAHYASVVEEIGIEDRDELPRPMGHLSFGEDIWRPFIRTVIALLYSYGLSAVALAWLPPPLSIALALLLAGMGTFIFPAIFLTATTSGNLVNLRPDRILSTIRTTGPQYLIIVVLYGTAAIIYAAGILACVLNGIHMIGVNLIIQGNAAAAAAADILRNGFVAYALLIVGIYLMHAFCWYLGLVYRAHHEHFGWAHQHHVRMTPEETLAMHAARRDVARHNAEVRKIQTRAMSRFLWW